MKKLSAIIASLVLFTSLSFAIPQTSAKSNKTTDKKEVKKVPAKKKTDKKDTKTTTK